jgi:adenosylcobinamide-GDP ribazoletransferase
LTQLQKQFLLFRCAVMFYTRIPVGILAQFDQNTMDQASRYFTLVGWLVGLFAVLVYWLGLQIFPATLAVALSMIATIWLTGAFHEDGLADSCDGLGGGWTQERILEIMKDSRVGTYGAIGLFGVLSVKFLALSALQPETVIVFLLAGHVMSRWIANLVMLLLPYVRLDESSKAKPITKGFAARDAWIASAFVLPVFVVLPSESWLALLGALPLTLYFVYLIKRWLHGYTGDTLGAVQQLSEVGIYLGAVAVMH